jgi:tetratricopeptide (TPR) repeat protein
MTAARTDRKFFLLACLGLALGTLALYWPVTGHPFVCIDDGAYIINNPQVQAGLTWHGLVWAFNGIHVGNWHPLTWISHMIDCQLFGLNAGGHHLVNVLFHIANTLLLFFFLRSTTNANWRSAFVAALFAWHPLHVESVAWISERKDVLSAFFWLLTLLAYARYANLSKAQSPKSKNFYALALVFCALALLSKSMAVTLPFTLLLLDFWPLGRIQNPEFRIQNFKRLLLEKVPFFLLSFALCVMTFFAQRGAGGVNHTELSSSLNQVPVAYARYISKIFWPADLSVIYPYVYHWPAMTTISSALLLVLFSILALVLLRRKPWLAVGWFWFLGTLVPVIGFVQVGLQSMADRYAYVPSIGLFIVVVWGACELAQQHLAVRKILPLIGGAVLAGCLATTSVQLSYWHNSIKLFFHALDTTPDNFFALNGLGCAFTDIGRTDDAIKVFQESVRIQPRYWPAEHNLAMALLADNRPDEAFKRFDFMLGQLPDDTDLRYEASIHLLEYKRVEDAKAQLKAALKVNPALAEDHELLGSIFLQQSNLDDAIPQFSQVLKINPKHVEAHLNLGLAFEQQGKFHEAADHFREALRLAPDSPEIKTALNQLLATHPELKPQP